MLARNSRLPAEARAALAPLESLPPEAIPNAAVSAAVALAVQARPDLELDPENPKVARGSVADVFGFRDRTSKSNAIAFKTVRADSLLRIQNEAAILARMAKDCQAAGVVAGPNFAVALAEARAGDPEAGPAPRGRSAAGRPQEVPRLPGAIAPVPGESTHLVSEVLPERRRHPCPRWDECAAARARAYLFCFSRGEELRSLACAFSFATSSRSATISFCSPADPGSPFDSLAGVGADGSGAEKGIHRGRKLAADNAAAGRTEVK